MAKAKNKIQQQIARNMILAGYSGGADMTVDPGAAAAAAYAPPWEYPLGVPEQPADDGGYYYGGGGGGGGGGGVYAPPSLGRIDDSPDWQALMAELARQEGLYQAEAERQKAITIADRDRLLGELAQRGEIERENVAGAMEARGLYRSGETEQRIARQRANELARQTAITTGAANRIGDIEAQLAMQQAELARRRIEARADFLARGYTA